MCPTCVGSGDATLMIAAHTHTPLETHLSLLHRVSLSRGQIPLQHLVILS